MDMSYFLALGYKTGNPAHNSYIIKNFQRHAGITSDGVIGPVTRARMGYYNKNNYCPEVFAPIKPYVPYTDEQVESLCIKGLVGLGKAFNHFSKEYDFNVLNNHAHASLESGNGTSKIARDKNNLYGWTAYDSSAYESATTFKNYVDSIENWSRLFNKYYLEPDGQHFRGNSEYAVNIVYASSSIAGINKAWIVKNSLVQINDEALDESEYTPVKYSDPIEKNFIFGESWSTKVINGKEVRRQEAPPEGLIPNILKGAKNSQRIRNKLNEKYSRNMRIGTRNSKGEITLPVSSWWRSNAFQLHLYNTKQSTTKTGHHTLGIAIDYPTPRGMTPVSFRDFVRDECGTDFTYYIVYSWGIHADWR
jgi:hypothetical protein